MLDTQSFAPKKFSPFLKVKSGLSVRLRVRRLSCEFNVAGSNPAGSDKDFFPPPGKKKMSLLSRYRALK